MSDTRPQWLLNTRPFSLCLSTWVSAREPWARLVAAAPALHALRAGRRLRLPPRESSGSAARLSHITLICGVAGLVMTVEQLITSVCPDSLSLLT